MFCSRKVFRKLIEFCEREMCICTPCNHSKHHKLTITYNPFSTIFIEMYFLQCMILFGYSLVNFPLFVFCVVILCISLIHRMNRMIYESDAGTGINSQNYLFGSDKEPKERQCACVRASVRPAHSSKEQ